MLRLCIFLIFCLLSAVQCAPSAKILDTILDSSPAQSVHYAYGRHYGYGHTPLTYAYEPDIHGYLHKHGYQHHGYNHGYGKLVTLLIFVFLIHKSTDP